VYPISNVHVSVRVERSLLGRYLHITFTVLLLCSISTCQDCCFIYNWSRFVHHGWGL